MPTPPAINVNLKPCADWCPVTHTIRHTRHDTHCPGAPVLIPLPIPRSVTFQVALGACECTTGGLDTMPHDDDCPARPVRVSCSVSGDGTWAESEVDDVWQNVQNAKGWIVDAEDADPSALAIARERWALVKALVLNVWPVPSAHAAVVEFIRQRDAVFSALADMARAEDAAVAAQGRLDAVLRPGWHARHRPDSHLPAAGLERPSRMGLAAYVERLIEQVWVMP